ncbi:HAD family hydrolase [Dysosmobacter sp.]|uniref:HAD family hydrolase n=1 Tax=Dysosmobacter sp. TaxID=2591382 RepID=UPI002A93396A|nr:HAD family hydrolase [Dysosmobacter sp.]MDY5612890.1 HAD family hydrolase [Dysosmobacter sp.]
MNRNIDTIFFDVGATLRYVVEDAEFSAAADRELMEIVGATESHDVFFEKLNKNWKAYRKLAKTVLLDVSEMELWLQYLLPDYPAEVIAPNAAHLTRLWRDHDGRRVPHDDVKPTLLELKRRGYKLGIIANTITETEIPDWMCHDQVADCFQTVILSSKVRLRKPDPAIYLLASRCIGSVPENCAYVGDNPVRDVEGAVDAGYGSMILYEDAGTADREGKIPTVKPDYRIKAIRELLDLFPAREGK